ncbi:hypothetical protein [Priestia aryabhattai]
MSILKFHDMPLYKQLKCVRVMYDLTQADLVEMLRLKDVPLLSRIERGEIPISRYYMERIQNFVYEGKTLTGSLEGDNQ